MVMYCYDCHCILVYMIEDSKKEGHSIYKCPDCKYKIIIWRKKGKVFK